MVLQQQINFNSWEKIVKQSKFEYSYVCLFFNEKLNAHLREH